MKMSTELKESLDLLPTKNKTWVTNILHSNNRIYQTVKKKITTALTKVTIYRIYPQIKY